MNEFAEAEKIVDLILEIKRKDFSNYTKFLAKKEKKLYFSSSFKASFCFFLLFYQLYKLENNKY